jgi:glutamate synthase domain-containing protein 2
MALGECAQSWWAVVTELAGFRAEIGEGGGLKNRCRELKKNAIGQVLACRILTVYGEVAERLKAAVC